MVEKWKLFAYAKHDPGDDTLSPPGSGAGMDDKGDNIVVVPRCVGYWRVFNACEVEGMPKFERPQNTDTELNALADGLIQSSRCPVRECLTGSACYMPISDHIEIPLRNDFSSNEAFIGTLLHEMAHSTGHPSALGRPLEGTFGSKDYAYEELIAELSSAFASSDLGLESAFDENSEHYQRHISYLASWKRALEEDPDVLFKAASAAEKASGYLTDRYVQVTGRELHRDAFLDQDRSVPEAEEPAESPAARQKSLLECARNARIVSDAQKDSGPMALPVSRAERS